MNEGRCESCVHWKNPWDEVREGNCMDAPVEDDSRWGVCVVIRHPGRGDYTEVEVEKYGWPPPPGPASPRAFTADGSDYLSELSTRNDFGCVEWTAS